jgi:hypothetical protein
VYNNTDDEEDDDFDDDDDNNNNNNNNNNNLRVKVLCTKFYGSPADLLVAITL